VDEIPVRLRSCFDSRIEIESQQLGPAAGGCAFSHEKAGYRLNVQRLTSVRSWARRTMCAVRQLRRVIAMRLVGNGFDFRSGSTYYRRHSSGQTVWLIVYPMWMVLSLEGKCEFS
jgi:hypothetical protein